MPGRTFSRDLKLEVVRQLAEGHKRPAQVCREYQLADSVLSRWRKEYAERGEAALRPRRAGSPVHWKRASPSWNGSAAS
jgi:transposase-like protein